MYFYQCKKSSCTFIPLKKTKLFLRVLVRWWVHFHLVFPFLKHFSAKSISTFISIYWCDFLYFCSFFRKPGMDISIVLRQFCLQVSGSMYTWPVPKYLSPQLMMRWLVSKFPMICIYSKCTKYLVSIKNSCSWKGLLCANAISNFKTWLMYRLEKLWFIFGTASHRTWIIRHVGCGLSIPIKSKFPIAQFPCEERCPVLCRSHSFTVQSRLPLDWQIIVMSIFTLGWIKEPGIIINKSWLRT